MNLIFLSLPSFLGGLIQGMAGFGCAIVMMLFFPLFLPIQTSSALCQAGALFTGFSMVLTYRKNINAKLCLRPWIFYYPVYYAALTLSNSMDTAFLKPVLGLALMAIAVYCACFSEKIRIQANWKTAGVCAFFSACGDAFFGIGGPPMVLYFLSTTDDNREYFGSIQLFFMTNNIIGTILRISKGQLGFSLIPSVITVAAMMIAGRMIGTNCISKINQSQLKKIVYGFTGISGMITFLTNVSSLHI